MGRKMTSFNPGRRLAIGASLLNAAQVVDTQCVKPALDPFITVHRSYVDASDKVDAADDELRAELARLALLDADQDDAVEALAHCLVVDRQPRTNPFASFGDDGPGAIKALPPAWTSPCSAATAARPAARRRAPRPPRHPRPRRRREPRRGSGHLAPLGARSPRAAPTPITATARAARKENVSCVCWSSSWCCWAALPRRTRVRRRGMVPTVGPAAAWPMLSARRCRRCRRTRPWARVGCRCCRPTCTGGSCGPRRE